MGFTEKNNAPSTFDADVNKLEDNLKKLDDSLDEIFSVLDRKISFDELCGIVSDEIDEFIPTHEKAENLEFIGGSCTFKVTGFIKKCATTAELYFRNDKNEYMKVTMSGALPLSKFTDESLKTDIAQLSKKELKVDIEHP